MTFGDIETIHAGNIKTLINRFGEDREKEIIDLYDFIRKDMERCAIFPQQVRVQIYNQVRNALEKEEIARQRK